MVLSTGIILWNITKSNQEVVGYYHDVLVTIPLVTVSYLSSQYCSSQSSYLNVINVSFSPLLLCLDHSSTVKDNQ